MKIYLIGAGGAGSWAAAAMVRLVGPKNIILIDGDKLEEKNLDRQLFSSEHIGQNKAEALASLYGCEAIPEWYSTGLLEHQASDVLMVAVDNHPARASALRACDFAECSAIFGANETHSAEAYLYLPEWLDGPQDPRTYIPEINTVTTGDPRAGLIGCTGDAQKTNPQLVTANFMAAALMMKLFVMHFLVGRKLDSEVRSKLAYRLVSNLSKFEEFKHTRESVEL